MHYNTTNQVGDRLKELNLRAGSQKEFIAKLFLRERSMTSSEAADIVFNMKYKPRLRKAIEETIRLNRDVLNRIEELCDFYGMKRQHVIISVRRCMSDLEKDGFLRKTNRKRKGYSDMENYIYELC